MLQIYLLMWLLASLVSGSGVAAIATSNDTWVSDTTLCACRALTSLDNSSTLSPNDANYQVERVNFWDVRSDLTPGCIFLPHDAAEIAAAVTILHDCDAQFAIRGGGHMNFPGSNNIDGGVLLALNYLTELELAPDHASVNVGPGNRLFDLYSYLEPYGLAAIGGRLKTIGVSGLTLIGGVHYFANKYGYAMDNVLSYDVVLGNGTQVTANATTHNDLFWALKGGANNFGLVTRFVMKVYKIPQISTTIQAYEHSQVPNFIRATCDMAENDDPSLGAGAVFTLQYNVTTHLSSASVLGVQEGTESPPSRFANFSAIPSVSRTDNVTTPAVWASKLDSPNQMFRIQFGHKTMTPNATRLIEIYQQWMDNVEQITDVLGLRPTFVVNIAPRSAASVAKQNGIGNTWGLDDQQSYVWWQVSTGWANQEDDLRMTAWSRSFIERIHSENHELGLATDFVYMGDAGEWQDVFAGFPTANLQRMRHIRSRYDVGSVFTRLNWGGFKLGY